MMHSSDGSGWGWAGWLLMGLVMLAFWTAVIWLVVVLVRSSLNKPNILKASPDAEDVLAERFARSEIDEAEYRDRLAVLAAASGRRTPSR